VPYWEKGSRGEGEVCFLGNKSRHGTEVRLLSENAPQQDRGTSNGKETLPGAFKEWGRKTDPKCFREKKEVLDGTGTVMWLRNEERRGSLNVRGCRTHSRRMTTRKLQGRQIVKGSSELEPEKTSSKTLSEFLTSSFQRKRPVCGAVHRTGKKEP